MKTKIKRLILAGAGTVIAFFILITLTTSRASYSQERRLGSGVILQAKDIQRNNIPFTKIWLRRNLEVVRKQPPMIERVISNEPISHQQKPWPLRLEIADGEETVTISIEGRESITIPAE